MGVNDGRLRQLLRRTGFDVVRFRGDVAAHQQTLLRTNAIDVVADVGANEGQYARRMRLLGYAGRIVSFEPLPDAARRLRSRASTDPGWTVHETAIGAEKGHRALHVSANSVSSSMLKMTDRHVAAEPSSAYVEEIDVPVEPLDAFASDLTGAVWLKIDVQGAEREVLEGAVQTLPKVRVVQAELSFARLYEEGPSALDIMTALEQLGFGLADVERGFTDPETGALLQADGLFVRT